MTMTLGQFIYILYILRRLGCVGNSAMPICVHVRMSYTDLLLICLQDTEVSEMI